MPDLLAARSQMGVSLAFHIVFAVVGIAMPVMMVVAERRWRVTGHAIFLDLAQRWARGTAILFAVGAVSGTVLSFELGLLWPGFMRFAGSIIGMPFSLEGFAFFTEAIFLGVYLYGWDRISPRAHLGAAPGPARAGEARRGGGAVSHGAGRAALAGGLAGRGPAGDPLRPRDPARAVAARIPRPQRAGAGARRGAARRLAERAGGAPLLPADGRAGHLHGPGRRLGRMAGVAPDRPGTSPVVDAGARARRADGVHRRRGGMDGDGAGSSAVGDLWGLEDARRGHADARPGRPVLDLHAAVLLPGRDRVLAPVPADTAQPRGSGVAGVLHAAGCSVTLADLLAGVIFVALNAYALLGGADFGGGVWDLFATGPRKQRQQQLIAEAIGPVWEANHVWLILAIVLLFTCFPPAFARLGTLLHIQIGR